jgi:hypothetical protein
MPISKVTDMVGIPNYAIAPIFEDLWKFNYFTMHKCNLKKFSKRNQNPSRRHNSVTNLKFQHRPKYHLSKILIKK